jgi:hypothetical protein
LQKQQQELKLQQEQQQEQWAQRQQQWAQQQQQQALALQELQVVQQSTVQVRSYICCMFCDKITLLSCYFLPTSASIFSIVALMLPVVVCFCCCCCHPRLIPQALKVTQEDSLEALGTQLTQTFQSMLEEKLTQWSSQILPSLLASLVCVLLIL